MVERYTVKVNKVNGQGDVLFFNALFVKLADSRFAISIAFRRSCRKYLKELMYMIFLIRPGIIKAITGNMTLFKAGNKLMKIYLKFFREISPIKKSESFS